MSIFPNGMGPRSVMTRPSRPITTATSVMERVTTDPDIYLKICYVCKDTAPKNEVHHLHYGGRACFSCRAFFRRSHEKTREPNFVCRRGGKCVVTPRNRRKCQACRLRLCKEVGMDPSLVLTEEQKKVRFRNAKQKKKRDATSEKVSSPQQGQGTSSGASSDNGGDPGGLENIQTTVIQIFAQPKDFAVIVEPLQASYDTDGCIPVHTAAEGYTPVQTESFVNPTQFDSSPQRFDEFSPSRPIQNSSLKFDTPSPQINSDVNLNASSTFPASPPADIFDTISTTEFNERPTINFVNEDLPVLEINENLDDMAQPVCVIHNLNNDMTQPVSQNLNNDMAYSGLSEDEINLEAILASAPSPLIETYMGTEAQDIIDRFNLAFSSAPLNPSLISRFNGFHQRQLVLSASDVQEYLTFLRNIFHNFAETNTAFQQFSVCDQRNLLDRNGPLFEQFYFGKYLIQPDGTSQFRWLFRDRVSFTEDMNFPIVSFDYLNEATMLYKDEYVKDVYKNFLLSLRHEGLTRIHPAIFANLLLFSSNLGNRFKDRKMVRAQYNKLLGQVEDKEVADAVQVAIDKLDSMTLIASLNSILKMHEEVPTDETAVSPKKLVRMAYTQEEKSWLVRQFEVFSQAFRKIPMGEDLIREYIMVSYDVPLAKHSITAHLSVAQERLRHVLKVHPEVMALSDADQSRLRNTNLFKGVALYLAKLESFSSARNQLQYVLTEFDNEVWSENFPMVDVNNLKRLCVDDFNKAAEFLPAHDMDRYKFLTRNIKSFLKDKDVFILVTLITIFSDDEAFSPEARKVLSNLRQRYSKLLQKTLEAKHLLWGMEINSKIMSVCTCTDELASLLKKVSM